MQSRLQSGLQVIGAGFGRTGTSSLRAALERLLGGRCYHMEDVVRRTEHHWAWYGFALDGQPMNWRHLLREYVACVDFPISLYYRELMELFPHAKVVLSVRDADGWWESWNRLMNAVALVSRLGRVVPRFGRHFGLVNALIFQGLFDGKRDKESAIAAFEGYNAEVLASVPKQRLLVWETSHGWEPLCAFLGCPVPEESFPRLNVGDNSLKRGIMRMAVRGLLNR